jgi:hypothetical protein
LANGGTNGAFGFFQIHNGTALHAAPTLPAKAKDARTTITFNARNQANYLGGTNIQHAKNATTCMAAPTGRRGSRFESTR